MYCKQCNSQIPEDADFCPNCGTSVYDDDMEATGVLSDIYYEQENDNSYNNVKTYETNDQFVNQNATTSYDENNYNSQYANQSKVDNCYSQQYSAIPNYQYQQNNLNNIEEPSLKNCYIKYWNNTANYTARARRSDYWYVVLMNFIISLVCSITVIGAPLAIVYTFASLPPTLSLIVRRLHDLGKDWYNIFIMLIPFAGPIIILIWLCKDSQVGSNEFGENPKGIN